MNTFKPLAKSLLKAKNQIEVATSCLDETMEGDLLIKKELDKLKPDYLQIELIAHQLGNISDLNAGIDILNHIYDELDYLSQETNNANK